MGRPVLRECNFGTVRQFSWWSVSGGRRRISRLPQWPRRETRGTAGEHKRGGERQSPSWNQREQDFAHQVHEEREK